MTRCSFTDEQRFLAKVRYQNDCWIWTAARGGWDGQYGWFSYDGRPVLAHRWAYEHWIGPIPDGSVIDHLCENTPCVNPDHLQAISDVLNKIIGHVKQLDQDERNYLKRLLE